jgi:hypothetical protein
MASPEEAFGKFRTWKKSKTVLKVTLLTNGTAETFVGTIAAVDEVAEQVSFAIPADRCHQVVSFVGVTFLVGKRRLEAERGEENVLMCEEIGC